MPLPRHRARRLAALAVTAAAAVVLGAVPSTAQPLPAAPDALPLHARLASSVPADGSSVGTAAEVVLTFSEEVNPSFVAVTVDGPAGDETDGPAVVDGRDVTQLLTPDVGAGEHVVTFRVVSADGHPVSGRVSFTTTQGAPSPTTSASPSTSASPTPSTADPPQGGAQESAAAAGEPASSADAGTMPWVVVGLGALVLAGALGAAFWRARRGASGADGSPGQGSS